MQVGAGGNRGTGCGQIDGTPFGRFHVDSLAHLGSLGWFYLTTYHLPPTTCHHHLNHNPKICCSARRGVSSCRQAATQIAVGMGRPATPAWYVSCRRQTMVLCCNPHLRLRLHLHERTHLDTAQEGAARARRGPSIDGHMRCTDSSSLCSRRAKACRGMGFGSGTSQAPVIKPIGASCASVVIPARTPRACGCAVRSLARCYSPGIDVIALVSISTHPECLGCSEWAVRYDRPTLFSCALCLSVLLLRQVMAEMIFHMCL